MVRCTILFTRDGERRREHGGRRGFLGNYLRLFSGNLSRLGVSVSPVFCRVYVWVLWLGIGEEEGVEAGLGEGSKRKGRVRD